MTAKDGNNGGNREFEGRVRDRTAVLNATVADLERTLHRQERNAAFSFFLNRLNADMAELTSAGSILSAFCVGAVDTGGFLLAWAGLLDRAVGRVVPSTAHGLGAAYVDDLVVTMDPALPTSCGPSRSAMVERRVFHVDDFQNDGRTAPWHSKGESIGVRSSAAIPIIVGGEAVGVLNVYSAELADFDEHRLNLLELAGRNVSAALARLFAETDAAEDAAAQTLSERRFHQAFDASPLAVHIYSLPTMRLRYANKASERLLGYREDEIADGAAWLDRIAPDPALRAMIDAGFLQDVQMALAGGPEKVVVSPELALRCKDGTERILRVSMSITGDDAVLQWEDLTESKRIQARAEASERNFRQIIEQNLLGIYVTQKHRIVYANPRFCEIIGVAEEDLLDRDSLDFLGQSIDVRRLVLKARATLDAGVDSQPVTAPFRRPDGADIVLTLHGAAGFWNGAPALIVMAEDITERQRAAETLERSERRFRETLDPLNEGCIIVGFDWRYLYVNAAAARQGHQTREALLGRPVLEVYPILRGAEILGHYQAVMRDRVHRQFEASWPFEDGTVSWFQFSVEPAPEGIVILRQDITARKRIEAELRAQDRLLSEVSAMAVIGGWEIDVPSGAVTWTPQAALIFDEADGKIIDIATAKDHYLEKYRPIIAGAVTAAIQDSVPFDIEAAIVTYTGAHKWVRVIGHPESSDGIVRRLYGSIQDITMRKQVESALSDAMVFNQAILDSVGTEIAVLDQDGVITAVNEPWRRFGADAGAIQDSSNRGIGVSYLDVCDSGPTGPTDGAQARQGIEAVLDGRSERFQMEYPCDLPDEVRWFSMSVTPLEGRARGAVVAHTDITERRRAEDNIARHARQLEHAMQGTLEAMANMVEARDPYTAGHERRVGVLASDIAEIMGWSDTRRQTLQLSGLVHDIGKIGIPAEILSKPARLTSIEYQLVQTHVEQGYQILKNVDFLAPIADIIREHHERLDGSGYPRGLKGEQILPEARVLAVADVVESMSSHRPYRPALGLEAALEEIQTNAGVLYDPVVVEACVRLMRSKSAVAAT